MGHEQAGISETLEFILKKYTAENQEKLVQNIFVTGALAKIPGFKVIMHTFRFMSICTYKQKSVRF